MGKHKEKKAKKLKKEKKRNKKERRYSSSSSQSFDEEWVEKRSYVSGKVSEGNPVRDEWMSLPTNFTSTSNIDRRTERENDRKLEKQKAVYNPSANIRELNPYWKGGGDGLPKFQKPSEDDTSIYKSTYSNTGSSNWRKKKPTVTTTTTKNETAIDESVDLNILASKLVKAEILGDTTLVAKLKEQLESARQSQIPNSNDDQTVILTETNSKGYARPLKSQTQFGEYSGGQRKKQKIETHSDGQRVRYFPDDDKYSLKQMFENEKYTSIDDSNREFVEMAKKVRMDSLDDVFTDNIRKKESDEKIDRRNKEKAIIEHRETTQALENCPNCLQSEKMLTHLVVTMKDSVYLSLPYHEPLTEGHCLIIPIRHASCSTQLDENEWSDIMSFRKTLTEMFFLRNEDVIFFETAMFLHRHPHMVLQCIPVPKEQGDLAPIYFKKAIDESEMEWSSNKKLVSLAGRDVRRAIPKGLPYFSVSFGMEEGFAHVIEDQRLFPNNFAQEIIGGILDLHHSKWRKPKKQMFEEQKQRVQNFSEEWNKYNTN